MRRPFFPCHPTNGVVLHDDATNKHILLSDLKYQSPYLMPCRSQIPVHWLMKQLWEVQLVVLRYFYPAHVNASGVKHWFCPCVVVVVVVIVRPS